MLKILYLEKYEATWDVEKGWRCSDEGVQQFLRNLQEYLDQFEMPSMPALYEGGMSGAVWKTVRRHLKEHVKLVELIPDPARVIDEEGVIQ